MAALKFVFLFSFVFALALICNAEEAPRLPREVETAQENTNELEGIQQQLMTAFDSFKQTMEELTSKLSTDEIVQGLQNIKTKVEGFAKQAADQLASTAASVANPEQKKEEVPPAP